MPYIKKEQREQLDDLVQRMNKASIPDEGTLNYLITQLCQAYVRQQGRYRYAVANSVIGALECAKLECYRRVIGKYEDQKIAENGDVY